MHDDKAKAEHKIAGSRYMFFSLTVIAICATISICVPVVHYNHVRFKPTNAEVAPNAK